MSGDAVATAANILGHESLFRAGFAVYLVEMTSYILALGLLGAVVEILWLLVFGVNEQHWKEQASAAAASVWR